MVSKCDVRFYKKVGYFFKKSIKIPKLAGHFDNHNDVEIGISWELNLFL